MTSTDAIELAITRAGGSRFLAAVLGVTRQAVERYRAQGYMPFARATRIEVLYGIPREDLVDAETREAYLTPPATGDDVL